LWCAMRLPWAKPRLARVVEVGPVVEERDPVGVAFGLLCAVAFLASLLLAARRRSRLRDEKRDAWARDPPALISPLPPPPAHPETPAAALPCWLRCLPQPRKPPAECQPLDVAPERCRAPSDGLLLPQLQMLEVPTPVDNEFATMALYTHPKLQEHKFVGFRTSGDACTDNMTEHVDEHLRLCDAMIDHTTAVCVMWDVTTFGHVPEVAAVNRVITWMTNNAAAWDSRVRAIAVVGITSMIASFFVRNMVWLLKPPQPIFLAATQEEALAAFVEWEAKALRKRGKPTHAHSPDYT